MKTSNLDPPAGGFDHVASSSEFIEQLDDIFAAFGSIQAKPMFGGHGIYHDGLMFALVADDVLYLKADRQSEQAFADLQLAPFSYQKGGKTMKMSYFAAPEMVFDDPEQAKTWAERAFDAALRANKPKKKSPPGR